jgi:hypothetical protein
MGNVPIYRRMIRRLTKNSSGTVSVSIPLEHVIEMGWKKGDYVSIEKHGSQLVVSPVDGRGKRSQP